MTRRPVIGRMATARWSGKCPQCGASFAPGSTLYRVAAARNAWCAVPCRGRADAPAPARPTSSQHPPGLDGTVRWADPAILAIEVSPAGRMAATATATIEGFDVAIERMVNGDVRPDVLAALDKGRAAGQRMAQPKAERLRWELDAVGALPSVPHYLAGCERTMLRPAMSVSESAPLRVWVSIGANWDVEEADLIERGGMLAGIVETLAAVRPVELVAYAHCTANVKLAWPVDPRDGARLCATFGQSALRGVVMRWIRDKDPNRSTAYDPTEESARRAFDIPPGDLVVRPFRRIGEGDAEDLRQYLES